MLTSYLFESSINSNKNFKHFLNTFFTNHARILNMNYQCAHAFLEALLVSPIVLYFVLFPPRRLVYHKVTNGVFV